MCIRDRTEAQRARLYRTAYAYLGGEAAAMEAVDEAVYQALRHLHQLRQPEYFETWLTRILINTCNRELLRLKRLHPAEYLPEAGEDFNYDTLPLREAVSYTHLDVYKRQRVLWLRPTNL